MRFPEKLLVGIEDAGEFNTETFPLGFATPFGTDSAYRKRQETVLRWATPGKYRYSYGRQPGDEPPAYDGFIIDNVPVSGFRIDTVVSRWTTSNKLYRVQDPRGFTLEISAANLCTLLMNSTCINGVFQGEFVWSRDGANNTLVSIESDLYKEHLSPKIAKAKIQPGDMINSSMLGDVIFIGKYYLAAVKQQSHATGGEYSYMMRKQAPYVYYARIWMERDLQPYHVFYHPTDNYYEVRRSLPKEFTIVSENNEFEPIELGVLNGKIRGVKDYTVCGTAAYSTKEDLIAAKFTTEEISNYVRNAEEWYSRYLNGSYNTTVVPLD